MKRSRIPLLAVFPATVLTGVVAIPLLVGDHPLRWAPGSLVPQIATGKVHATAETAPPQAAPSTADPAPSVSAAPLRVGSPWKPGMPQWGVQIYWEDNPRQSLAYITEKAKLQAKYLIGLRANSVALSFPFYTGTQTSTKTFAGPRTPSTARLEAVLRVFQDAGLRTTVRPLLDERSLGGPPHWRGTLKPSDRNAWFASYGKFLDPYVDVAQKLKVASFTLGSELNSLEGDPRWKKIADKVEKRYSGEIEYDANYDNYVRGRIVMPVEQLGVDAYFPINAPDNASVQTLVKGWNTWLDKKSTGSLPKIVLSEAGIAAMKGAFHAPGDFYVKRPLNTTVQANWYTAVCQVVKERKMKGVYWWSLYFDDNPFTTPDDKTSRLHFAGRPGTEKAIRDCFGSNYTLPATP